ncbi:Ion transport peptide, partial [Stegodyphus mimosarum]
MGTYNPHSYARLEAICEECYQLYRVPDIFSKCRSNCFKNSYRRNCTKALLYTDEEENLEEMVRMLFGKRR